MNDVNPYISCPVLETELFLLRLVEEEDAEDLLGCYSDKASLKIFNSDNCPIDFYFDTEAELHKLIKFWLMEYSESGYVRFSVVDKKSNKAVGTIEIFAKKETFNTYGKVGLFRLDLPTVYEKSEFLNDILSVVLEYFGELFKINSIITKGNSYAKTRTETLKTLNFHYVDDRQITMYEDYYIKML
ncbi:hypothetical protein QE109_01685 [Fusibacter bizertensis]|uniref:N-acetyltransferase n=1 Tax=Fusibacter bizertensis TaxID=1488331 RepID=A0ABT6N8V5_9FIRM|nr:hypothetical protein [Fusibacter bizertensis]MDH8676835.1 hypothetical protein [Fusibacter bizertensis]